MTFNLNYIHKTINQILILEDIFGGFETHVKIKSIDTWLAPKTEDAIPQCWLFIFDHDWRVE